MTEDKEVEIKKNKFRVPKKSLISNIIEDLSKFMITRKQSKLKDMRFISYTS